MIAIKVVCWLAMMAGFIASSAGASDNEAETRRLFEETTWGGVYTCAAIDQRLHPESASAHETVLRVFEKANAIPQAHGQAFRKLASAKVDALSAQGQMAKFAAQSCAQAKVVYMTTGK